MRVFFWLNKYITYNPWQLTNNLLNGTTQSNPYSLKIPATGYPTYGLTNPPSSVLSLQNTNTLTNNPPTNNVNNPTGGEPSYDPYAGIKSQINSGYDSYLSQLDSQLNENLPQQRSAQESMVGGQYNQSLGNLDTQKTLGYSDLDIARQQAQTNQAKTLKDLSANLRNQYMAGNNFLGAMGAADSSAANQYSYALTKLGNKSRADVMNNTSNIFNDINNRKFKIDTIYNQNVNDLNYEKDIKMGQIAQWYSTAQQQLQQMKAQVGMNRSTDLANLSQRYLDIGLQWINQLNTDIGTRKNMLDTWAQGQTQNVASTLSQLQQQGTPNYQLPSYVPISGSPYVDQSTGQIYFPGNSSSSTTQQNQLTNPLFSNYSLR